MTLYPYRQSVSTWSVIPAIFKVEIWGPRTVCGLRATVTQLGPRSRCHYSLITTDCNAEDNENTELVSHTSLFTEKTVAHNTYKLETYLADYTLLLDTYLLKNLSLRVATASATSQTPNIFKHSAAISEVFTLNIFLPHDTTTWLKDLSCRGLTGQASKPCNSIGMHFVLNSSIITSTDANLPTFP